MSRMLLKAFPALCTLGVYVAIGLVVSAVPGAGLRRRLRVFLTHWYSRLVLRILAISVDRRGDFRQAPGSLLVANHQSYLDIVVIASIMPVVFVTSHQMRKRGLLGLFSCLGGSVFVHRQGTLGLRRDLRAVADVLRAGFTVCLFPEAASSAGGQLLPFKSALFASAVQASCCAVPLCIKYVSVNGHSIRDEHRAVICYTGREKFLGHLHGVMRLRSIRAFVKSFEPVDVASAGRRNAAMLSYDRIRTEFTSH